MIHFLKLRNLIGTVTIYHYLSIIITKLQALFGFTGFSTNVLFLSQDGIQGNTLHFVSCLKVSQSFLESSEQYLSGVFGKCSSNWACWSFAHAEIGVIGYDKNIKGSDVLFKDILSKVHAINIIYS